MGLGITRKSSNELNSKVDLSELDDEPNEMNTLINHEQNSSDDIILDDFGTIEIVTEPSGDEDDNRKDEVNDEELGSPDEEKFLKESNGGGSSNAAAVGESAPVTSTPHRVNSHKLSSNSFYNTNNGATIGVSRGGSLELESQ